jgi:hypothetical protein
MPTTSNVLCGCGRFMRPKQNSVTVEELLEDGRPYKLWDADLYYCEDCDTEVITGFGRTPITEHFQRNYAATRARLAPIYEGRCRPHDDNRQAVTGTAGRLRLHYADNGE